MSRPLNRFERHPVLARILLVVVAIGLLVLVDVLAATALGALGVVEPNADPERRYRVRDPLLHHALKPDTVATGAWGQLQFPVITNSLGFRDAEVRDVPLDYDGERVLLMGDSFTEGIGLPWEQTFAGILAHRLAADDVAILNGGVVSYSPVIYRRRIDQLVDDVGLEISRVVLLLDLSDVEDQTEYVVDDRSNAITHVTEGEFDERFKRFIADRTVVLSRVRAALSRRKLARRENTVDRSLGKTRALWTVDAEVYDRYAEAGLRLAERDMDAIVRLLDAHAIPLTVVVYPWPDQIHRGDLDSKHVRYWRDWAGRHDVDFLDLFPYFVGVRDDPTETIGTYFIPGDTHWNAAGHALVAERLIAHLLALRLDE